MKLLNMIFILLFLSTTWATGDSSFQQCLQQASVQVHILDQISETKNCFQIHKDQISSKSCFQMAEQVKIRKKYIELNETLNSICFYETTFFQDIKSCLKKASHFKTATYHDDAVFECYLQFQNKINNTQCVELSRQLIYPEKRKYMFHQCQNTK